MSGLPYQTLDKFLESLQTVIRLKPEHISAYSLIIEKGTPFNERYKFDAVKQEAGLHTEILPGEDEVYRIYKATQDVLKQAGYRQYEISNFAQPGYACRHNIGYWTRENYLGLGLGASSLVENVRYTNTRQLYAYGEFCDHLQEKSPAEFLKDGEHAVPEDLWIGSCVQEQAQILTRKEQMEELQKKKEEMRRQSEIRAEQAKLKSEKLKAQVRIQMQEAKVQADKLKEQVRTQAEIAQDKANELKEKVNARADDYRRNVSAAANRAKADILGYVDDFRTKTEERAAQIRAKDRNAKGGAIEGSEFSQETVGKSSEKTKK